MVEHREHQARYVERHRERVMALHREQQRRYRNDGRRDAKDAATSAVRRAVKAGKIKKPTNCENCGSSGALHAHHINGYEPQHVFDVRWVCPVCHGLYHRKVSSNA